MAGVREWFCGLIVALGGTASVHAQGLPFTCNTSIPVAPTVRGEGYTEQVGDLILNCTGGSPTAAGVLVPQVSFTIFLNTNITNRVIAANMFSEALLLVDEPNSPLVTQQSPHPVLNCGQTGAPDNGPGLCAITSTGNPASTYDATANGYGGGGAKCDGAGGRPPANSFGCGRPNVFQGRVGSLQDSGQYNAVTFLNVPVDPPGAGVSRTFRFTNLRANAAGIGARATFRPGQIQMNIVTSPAITISNPQQVAAYIDPGLYFTSSLSSPASSVRFQESFAWAWKTRNLSFTVGDHSGIAGNATYSSSNGIWTYNGGTHYPADVAQNVPGAVYSTESAFQWQNNSTNAPPTPNPPPEYFFSGVPNQGTALNSHGFGGLDTGIRNAGVASAGTRLALRFTGVPGGASVLVPSVVYLLRQNCTVNCQTVMVLTSTDDAGASPFTPATSATVAVGTLAVYEILYTEPYILEYADIPCQLSTGQSLPSAGVGVNGSFAPLYSSLSAGTAVPRFGPSAFIPAKAGVFRAGFWAIDSYKNWQWDVSDKYVWFGQAGDIPVVGDFDGDGVVEIGIFRSGIWALDINHNGVWDASDLYAWLGQAGDIPVVGDFNGDGRDDRGVFRSGFWAIDINHNGQWDASDRYVWLGQAGDVPVVGDFNGDSVSEMGVFRNGFWAIDTNYNGQWDASDKYVWLGQAGDVPVVGDFNGDGTAEMGVFRSGFWAIDMNRNGAWDASDGYYWLGQSGDIPVVVR